MDLTSPINCLTFNLLRAARSLTRRFDAAMAPLGLSAQQFSALALLSGFGPLPVTRLADAMGTERTTVTRNMAVLKRAGLVAEDADPEDARVTVLALTEPGRARLADAMPIWRAFQASAVEQLGPDLAPDFLDMLKRL